MRCGMVPWWRRTTTLLSCSLSWKGKTTEGGVEGVRGLSWLGPAEGRKKMGQEGEELGRRVDRVQGG